MKMAALFVAAALAQAAPAGGEDGATRLTVHVSGADPGVGEVSAALYYGEAELEAAMSSKGSAIPYRSVAAPVDDAGRATLVFEDIAPAEYAVSVHHDRDRDGVVDSGLLGIPTEKIGFSNDPHVRFGPPSWEDTRLRVGAEGSEITIVLKHVGPF